jgi:hypothetical protein
MDQILPGAIFLGVVVWTIIIAIYIVRNNFAKESIDVFYPVLGAIILSSFLAVKAIWVDAPPDKELRESVALIHRMKTGELMSPYRRDVNDGISVNSIAFGGLEDIQFLNITVGLEELKLAQNLKAVTYAESIEKSPQALDQLEYIFWDWFAKNTFPAWLSDSQMIEGITGAGGGVTTKVTPHMIEKITLDEKIFPDNPLFKARPIIIQLPTGSILRTNSFPLNRTTILSTKYSESEFKLIGGGGGALELGGNNLTRKISSQFGFSPDELLASYSFGLQWKFHIKPFARYSVESKLQKEWFDVMSQRIRETFSWTDIKGRLQRR